MIGLLEAYHLSVFETAKFDLNGSNFPQFAMRSFILARAI